MLPIRITVRHFPESEVLNRYIHNYLKQLMEQEPRIQNCSVVIEFSQKRKHQGKLFHVSAHLTVPHKRINVTKQYHENAYTAVHNAMHALAGQLQKCKQRRAQFVYHRRDGSLARALA